MMEIIKGGCVTSARGFLAGATFAGLKTPEPGKLDLGILYAQLPCSAAGVFTTNLLKAAPVQLCESRLAQSPHLQAVIVNSGIANAGTGQQGLDVAERMAALAAQRLGIPASLVAVASTGKIGWQIPMDKISAAVPNIAVKQNGGHDVARAIMTTDTRPKEIAVRIPLRATAAGSEIIVAGMGKGAGMIHPQMATMLAFVTTDAVVDPAFLKQSLRTAADRSFNMVSIDGDMSTNDTLIALASGMAGNAPIRQGTIAAGRFQMALDAVCTHLAREIARDGEGATRLIEITVRGAASLEDARLAARAIASSNLTKCAIHGADPNWGRIAAAAGRSGAQMDPTRLDVTVGGVALMHAGNAVPFDAQAAHAALSADSVAVVVDFHLGQAEATGWGCDMSEEYVTFNSEYTT
jgi:glutamate N-acetyltransferase/amino-acid N-acetyltransferase